MDRIDTAVLRTAEDGKRAPRRGIRATGIHDNDDNAGRPQPGKGI